MDVAFRGSRAGRRVALSLDDGPLVTEQALDVLAAHSARATFFLLGERAQGRGELLARLRSEGHEVGNHGWRDERAARLTDPEFETQLLRTEAVLGPARLYRPGSGFIRRSQVAIAARHGYRCVLGTVYPLDAHLGTRPRVIAAALHWARPGAIIILHERPRAPAALGWLLPRLYEHDLEVVTVGDLLREEEPPEHRTPPR